MDLIRVVTILTQVTTLPFTMIFWLTGFPDIVNDVLHCSMDTLNSENMYLFSFVA